MGNIGWINMENDSIDCMLRIKCFRIRLIPENLHDEAAAAMAAALKAKPKTAVRVRTLTVQTPDNPKQVRK